MAARFARYATKIAYMRGYNAALQLVWGGLAGLTHQNLTVEQRVFREGMFNFLLKHFPRESELRPQPTNAELASKYGVCLRTITNWRGAGCPFEKGQWGVLDWLYERRILPSTVRAKFARQFQRRRDREHNEIAAQQGMNVSVLLGRIQDAKKAGLL